MQQHRRSIHATRAGFIGGPNQRGFRRAINRIKNHVMWREQSRRDGRWIARIHPQGCRINDKIDLGKLRAQYCFVPRNRFETRRGTKHARSGKVRPQPLRKRLCFFVSTIDKNEAFAILERTLQGNCMARSATRSKDHHPQLAQIDREFGADGSQESFPVGV